VLVVRLALGIAPDGRRSTQGQFTSKEYHHFLKLLGEVFALKCPPSSVFPLFPENKGLKNHQDQMDPKHLLDKILACEHIELGKETVDGIQCEGLETTDPAFMGELPGEISSLEVFVRMWVDVETKYPVRWERKITAEPAGEAVTSDHVVDQFQWDVEIDPAFFQPEIPPDYEQM
jgi:hypothetical protein